LRRLRIKATFRASMKFGSSRVTLLSRFRLQVASFNVYTCDDSTGAIYCRDIAKVSSMLETLRKFAYFLIFFLCGKQLVCGRHLTLLHFVVVVELDISPEVKY